MFTAHISDVVHQPTIAPAFCGKNIRKALSQTWAGAKLLKREAKAQCRPFIELVGLANLPKIEVSLAHVGRHSARAAKSSWLVRFVVKASRKNSGLKSKSSCPGSKLTNKCTRRPGLRIF